MFVIQEAQLSLTNRPMPDWPDFATLTYYFITAMVGR